MLRAIRWGLVIGGVGAIALDGILGGRIGALGLLGLLALSLALNLWLLPFALRRAVGGWRPRLPRPAPPPDLGARAREEVEAVARTLARTLEGPPPILPSEAPVVFRCPHCGQRLERGAVRCAGCGQPARFRCPYCAREVDPGWRHCPACRAPLPAAWEGKR
ncbi:hypothetical protein HRbin22_00334 [Candidatus Thermoflexus japonica]|uniref:DZANK-type domain-containing protein n=1 Tax=Candidatus Thermoflexus japonica TaxID=2035417 RepID=A0A2H5Y3X0_9CHLR|nr:hypothetical protein HRbin22_00334 [Candidatus Thermoflexus japonica]